MKVIKKEYMVELENGMTARVVINLARQASPWDGDSVTAEATVELPCDEYGELPRELVFGERVWVFGERLDRKWGLEMQERFVRSRSELFTKPTRSEAMRKAERYAMWEVAKLVDAVERRKKARER